jgi:hypothetical protein
MPSHYSYHPPKPSGFGHVPLTRDRVGLLDALRAFLAAHGDVRYIQAKTLVMPRVAGAAHPGTRVAERFAADMGSRFGAMTAGGFWQCGGADLDPALAFLASVVAWPEWDGSDHVLSIGFYFAWRHEPAAEPDARTLSFITLYLGHFHLVQPFLHYASWDSLHLVEPDFKAFKLFKLNPKHYRFNGRTLKAAP